jgi:hypothetical protein
MKPVGTYALITLQTFLSPYLIGICWSSLGFDDINYLDDYGGELFSGTFMNGVRTVHGSSGYKARYV